MRVIAGLFLVAVALLAGCEREERQFRALPASTSRLGGERLSELEPGPSTPDRKVVDRYHKNAFGIAEGMRLFRWYNCQGCHANGGGGMGPPLMDEKWIYGGDPENIYATIVEGRPNGMPSFRAKIPEDEVWKIVAYVRSLGGLPDQSALPGRPDHMRAKDEGVPNYPDPLTSHLAEHP